MRIRKTTKDLDIKFKKADTIASHWFDKLYIRLVKRNVNGTWVAGIQIYDNITNQEFLIDLLDTDWTISYTK